MADESGAREPPAPAPLRRPQQGLTPSLDMYPPLAAVRDGLRGYTPTPQERVVLAECRRRARLRAGGGAAALGAVGALVARYSGSPAARLAAVAGSAALGALVGAASTASECLDRILVLDRDESVLRGDAITTVLRYNPEVVPVLTAEWEEEVLARQRREAAAKAAAEEAAAPAR